MTAQQAIAKLQAGNQRFVADGAYTHRADSAFRRILTQGQHPYAVVVACADSRVAPEVLFDTALGDIFVVRVAGNVLCDSQIASVEYAVHHLGTPLVVVLGHTGCGAIAAAMQGEAEGAVGRLVANIAPHIAGITDPTLAACANVQGQLAALRAFCGDACTMVGALYDLATGLVRWLD